MQALNTVLAYAEEAAHSLETDPGGFVGLLADLGGCRPHGRAAGGAFTRAI